MNASIDDGRETPSGRKYQMWLMLNHETAGSVDEARQLLEELAPVVSYLINHIEQAIPDARGGTLTWQWTEEPPAEAEETPEITPDAQHSPSPD
jgi:hypothetical protein